MLGAEELRFHVFGERDPLDELGSTRQYAYLRRYLDDLGASSIVEEAHYFDRNYLDEFAAFYGTSARGYPNVCRRLTYSGTRTFSTTRPIVIARSVRVLTSSTTSSRRGC